MGSQAVGGSFKESLDPVTRLSSSPLLLAQQADSRHAVNYMPTPSSAPMHLEGGPQQAQRQPVTLTRLSLSLSSSAGIWSRRHSQPQTDRHTNRAWSQPNCPFYPAHFTEIQFPLRAPPQRTLGKSGWVVESLPSAVKQICIQNLAVLHASCDLRQVFNLSRGLSFILVKTGS